MKQVVITGVSTGIGYACVKVLLSREFRVYGSVRNQTDTDRLQRDFGERFVPLLFDVTDEETVQAEAARVSEHLGTDMLDGLEQCRDRGCRSPGPSPDRPVSTPTRGQPRRSFYCDEGVSAAARHRSDKERDSWEDCEHQLRRWQDCRALHGRLLGIEVRTGRFLRKLAARTDAVWD